MKNKIARGQVARIAFAMGTAASCIVSASGDAQAGDPWSVQLGAASQYLGKGVGKSNEKPSISGSVEFARNGFYASLFAASAELSQGADAEVLTTVGYRAPVGDFDLDLSVINRDLPGTLSGVDANYTEYQADASRKLGPVSTRLRVNYTADGFAATQQAWWIELQAGVTLDAKTKATVAVEERAADGGPDYEAWNAGLKRRLSNEILFDLRWYDTNGHRFGAAYDGRLVGALTYSF